jgi:hypothetical protein
VDSPPAFAHQTSWWPSGLDRILRTFLSHSHSAKTNAEWPKCIRDYADIDTSKSVHVMYTIGRGGILGYDTVLLGPIDTAPIREDWPMEVISYISFIR